MERNLKVVYRIAEKKSKTSKDKPEWVNNENCLKNALRCFPSAEFYIFGDKLKESKKLAQNAAHRFFEIKNHGNASSFMEVLDYVLENFDDEDYVYFLEDDYIHREGAEEALLEGLEIADYVSLYDHLDKYSYPVHLLEDTRIKLTKSSHWRTTPSTTMSFATKVKTIRYDYNVFKGGCENREIPFDHSIFSYLTDTKDLITPMPGYSTHGETKWLSPLIDWQKELYLTIPMPVVYETGLND